MFVCLTLTTRLSVSRIERGLLPCNLVPHHSLSRPRPSPRGSAPPGVESAAVSPTSSSLSDVNVLEGRSGPKAAGHSGRSWCYLRSKGAHSEPRAKLAVRNGWRHCALLNIPSWNSWYAPVANLYSYDKFSSYLQPSCRSTCLHTVGFFVHLRNFCLCVCISATSVLVYSSDADVCCRMYSRFVCVCLQLCS